jgi:hypothetical protein
VRTNYSLDFVANNSAVIFTLQTYNIARSLMSNRPTGGLWIEITDRYNGDLLGV